MQTIDRMILLLLRESSFHLVPLISAATHLHTTPYSVHYRSTYKLNFSKMNCCGHCRDAGDFFNHKVAKRDLKRYLKRGPHRSTRLLLDAIRAEGVEDSTLLDIGGGIGVIQLELFESELYKSINVDASASYQEISREEANKRGYEQSTEYHFGDFTDLSHDLPSADIVTLDRVICCYPDADHLLSESLQKSKQLFGLVYPRKTVFTKLTIPLGNLWFRIRNSSFRIYLHPPQKVDGIIRSHGFQQIRSGQTFLWQMALYQKRSDSK